MKFFRYLFWLAVPLLLWWALRNISLNEVGAVFHRLTPGQLFILIGVNALVLLLFSTRWWLISQAQGFALPYLTMAGYRLASFGVTYFTPGPQFGGEPLQVYLVERKHRVPRTTAISSVSLDKSLELLANFTFLALGVVIILQGRLFSPEIGRQAVLMAVTLLGVILALLAAIWRGHHPVSKLWQVIAGRWAQDETLSKYRQIHQTIRESETQATRFFREQPVALGLALAASGIIWLGMIGEFWLATHILGLNLTLVQVITLLTAARIAFLLPMPGGLGTLEASLVLALTVLSLNPAVGIGLALLIRGRDVTLGVLGLVWGGLLLQSTKRYGKAYIKT